MAFHYACIPGIVACLLLGALSVPLNAFGEEPVGPLQQQQFPPPSETQSFPDAMNMLDAPRDYLSDKLVGFVSSIDRFFGDERHFQETNSSVFQLDINRVMGYGGEHRFVLSGRANVNLPMAEKKLHLLLESNPDKNAITDPKQTQPPPQNEPATPQSFGAALRFARGAEDHWYFSSDFGLKFHGLDTTPFARARGSIAVPLDQWRMKLAETAFWFNTIGVGETTQLDLERTISAPMLFRATSVATWLHDTQNFDLRQDLTWFHKLDERAALQYQASVIGASQPITEVNDYVLLMQYRYRLHREWMFFDVSPQLHFPRVRGFQLSPQLNLRLEMLFDEVK